MRILLIHGQNHRGTTCNMGRMLAQRLMGEKGAMEEFFLPRDLNGFCLGCGRCIEDEAACPYWKYKQPLLAAMERADVFILTTPNYCLAPSAAMKSFLDMFFDLWMVHRPKAWMFTKRAVVLSASAGASCKKALSTVRDSLFYWGVPCIRTYGRAVQAMRWEDVKPKTQARIRADLERIAISLMRPAAPRAGIRTRVIFGMMRMMHAKGWDASPVERQYWQAQGWLGAARPWKR